MKGLIKKGICIAMVSVFFIGCFACSKEGGADVVAGEKPIYEKGEVMPIHAYCPPLATAPRLQDYLDAGLNTFFMTEDYNAGIGSEEYLNQLALCQEMGLDVIIYSYDHHNIPGLYEYSGTDNCYLDLINFNLEDYPAIKGIYMWDEPSYKKFDELYNKLGTRYNEKYKNEYPWHVNLLPSYAAPGQQLGVVGDANESAYEKYIKGYFEKVHSKIEGENKLISLDHYPLRKSGEYKYISTSWLYDLAVFTKEASKYSGKYGCYIQTYAEGSGVRKTESSADIGIQVYSSLAFGVQYMGMYHYTSFEGSRGMVEGNGKLNDTYYHVQKVLKDVHSFEHAYLSFDWKGVMPVIGALNEKGSNECFKGMEKYSLRNLPGVSNVVGRDDALIGYFVDDKGRNGYMVANFSDPVNGVTNVVELEMKDYAKALVYIDGEEVCADVIGGKLRIVLPKGEGAFVVPY